MKRDITVIIPIYKPDRRLHELLYRLSRQIDLPSRVLLINTVDDDEENMDSETGPGILIDEFRNSFPVISLFHIAKQDFDHGLTRDLGFRFAKTELVMCMTQDALPVDSRLTHSLSAAFENPCVAVSYARQLPGKRSSETERFSRYFNYPAVSAIKSKEDLPNLGIKTFFCSDVCAMWRRDLYMQEGGFDHPLIFNEDMILAWKLIQSGYRIAYIAEAKVWHYHNYPVTSQMRRNFDLGVSHADYPQIFSAVSSEGEGMRYVRMGVMYLTSSGHVLEVPGLLCQSFFKYMGYMLGKHYFLIPKALILRLTDNKTYWLSHK